METSESGAPVHRHEARDREFEVAHGDSENIERISDHIEQFVGPVGHVFHELISDLVHIDIHIVKPSAERPYYTLVTSGMSDRPMAAPPEYPDLNHSELLLCLPPDWPMSQADWEDEENYWPIRTLKFLARFPHEYDAWLWSMHTMPNGNPPEPFSSRTAMNGVILLPPLTTDPAFYELAIDEKKIIHFHAVVPLYQEEMDLKLKAGAEGLFEGFETHGVNEVLNLARPNTVAKKKRWFGFGKR